MPQVKRMTQQELQQKEKEKAHLLENKKKEYSEEEFAELAILLQGAADIYLSKFGTYLPGAYKQFNENKVRSSFRFIESLLTFYIKNGMLTEKQITHAKRLIRNASKLE